MYYHEYEPETMAPFLRGLVKRFLNRTGTPDQASGLGSPYQFIQPLIFGEGSQPAGIGKLIPRLPRNSVDTEANIDTSSAAKLPKAENPIVGESDGPPEL